MKQRFYALLLVSLFVFLFMPEVRDNLMIVSQRVGAQERLEDLRAKAEPATAAIIQQVRERVQTKAPASEVPVAVTTPPAGNFGLNTGPSLTADEFEAVLERYDSPAQQQGLGNLSVELSNETGVDNAIVLAIFIHESTAGTANTWAGKKPNGNTTANVGNIICFGGLPCYGRFLDFNNDWKAGLTATFKLLQSYREGSGWGYTGKQHQTIREALNTYAPPVENDTNRYADFVEQQVTEWRNAKQKSSTQTATTSGAVEPWPHFLTSQCAGSHDGGAYDFCHPLGTEVRAPIGGTFASKGRYDDAKKYGEYIIWIADDAAHTEVYFGHLEGVPNLQPGDRVEAGTVIGRLTRFAYSTEHTHVQMRQNGQLVEVLPILKKWGLQ